MNREVKRDYDWHHHYYTGNLGLAILMYDEVAQLAETIGRVRPRMTRCILARTGTDVPEDWKQHLDDIALLEALPDDLSKWEIPVRAITRGFSCLSKMAARWTDVDWWVFVTGDTVLVHEYGIECIVLNTNEAGADLGVCRAVGQDFHAADLTLEDLQAGKGGGRKQTKDVPDFMPQLFVARAEAIRCGLLDEIPVVNRWCSEECLGVAGSDAIQHIYSEVAAQYSDGVIHHAR